MGNDVGELRYGTEISEEIFQKFINDENDYELNKEIQEKHPKIDLYNPYETSNYLIIHKDVNKKEFTVYNHAEFLGKNIVSNSEKWDKEIKKFCNEFNIPFDSEICGWFLIGRYD